MFKFLLTFTTAMIASTIVRKATETAGAETQIAASLIAANAAGFTTAYLVQRDESIPLVTTFAASMLGGALAAQLAWTPHEPSC